MFKKILAGLAIIAVVVIGYFAIDSLKPKPVAGQKKITITLVDKINDKVIIDKKTFTTTAETLGGFFDEDHKGINVTLSSSDFGRAIDDFNGLDGDMASATGPWITYESANNQSCVANGYCTGIDDLPIYDGDDFVFSFSDSSFFE